MRLGALLEAFDRLDRLLSRADGAAWARSMRSSRSVNLANWALALRLLLSTLDLIAPSSVRRLAMVSRTAVRSIAAIGVSAATGCGRANTEVPSAPAMAPSAPANATEAASMAKRFERGSSATGRTGAAAAASSSSGATGVFAASADFIASAAFMAASTGFGISITFAISIGLSTGLARPLTGAVASIAAGSGNARLIC